MTAALKCPCCGRTAEHLIFRNVEAHGPHDEVVTTMVLSCPGCELMLGASVNPAEYVAAMLRQIRARDDERPSPQRASGAAKALETQS
jgi:C4-type Zn-finger protein